MTTKVTVDAHAGWPVEIVTIDNGAAVQTEIVAPGQVRDVYATSSRGFIVRELNKPAAT